MQPRRRCATLLSIALLCALPFGVLEGGEGNAVQPDDLVTAELQPLIRALSRPVYTYHYVHRPRLNPTMGQWADPHDPQALDYFKMKVGRYWDLSLEPHPYATASGFYVGSDPVMPRPFGGTGDVWAALQVPLDKGFRLIDVRRYDDERHNSQKFSTEAQAGLRAQGCEVEYPTALLVNLEDQHCRRIAVRVLRALNVDGILYDFPVFRFPQCSSRETGGIIILSARAVRTSEILLLTPEPRRDAASADRSRIEGLYLMAKAADKRRTPLWPALDASVPSDAVLREWMRTSLFGCGGFAEDAMPEVQRSALSDAVTHYREAVALSENQDLEFAVRQYEEALKIKADYVEAIHDLAWIRAAANNQSVRDPKRAMELAELLVTITHYRERPSTTGSYYWSKPFKIRCSQVLAISTASAGDHGLSAQYIRQATETARKFQLDHPGELADRLVADCERFRLAIEKGSPIELTTGELAAIRLPESQRKDLVRFQ